MYCQGFALAFACALVKTAAAVKTKNFIYIVPDGYGISSQVLARDFYSITNGEGTVARPNTAALGVDNIVRKETLFSWGSIPCQKTLLAN